MNCPVCRTPMRKLELLLTVVDHCDACEDGGVVTEEIEQEVTEEIVIQSIRDILLRFGCSKI